MVFAHSSLHDSVPSLGKVGVGDKNSVKVSDTHGITLSSSWVEKSQCVREQHRSVVQNMLV